MIDMLIKVKVYPESDENTIIKKSEDSYIVKVRAKKERGEANQQVKNILADYFKISSVRLKLLKGGRKLNKIFEMS